MKRNTCFKKILAVFCVISLFVCSVRLDGFAGTEAGGEGTGFKELSFDDWGFDSTTYSAGTNLVSQPVNTSITSLDKVAFTGNFTFIESVAGDINDAVWIGGKNNGWGGLNVFYTNGEIHLMNRTVGNEFLHSIAPSALGIADITKTTVQVRLTFEYVANTTDVIVTYSLNGTTYYNQTIAGLQDKLGTYMMLYYVGSKVHLQSVDAPTEKAFTELSFSNWGIADGSYDTGTELTKQLTDTQITSLNNVAFTGNVTFRASAAGEINDGVWIGGKNNGWGGLNVFYTNGEIHLMNRTVGNDFLKSVPIGTLGINDEAQLAHTTIKVRIVFEYIENTTSVRVTYSLNDTIYYEGAIAGLQDLLGTYMMVYYQKGTVDLESVQLGEPEEPEPESFTEITFADYEVADGSFVVGYDNNALCAKNLTDLDEVAFTGHITFGDGENGHLNCVRIGGKDSGWVGLGIFYANGQIWLWNHITGEVGLVGVTLEQLGMQSLEESVKVRLTFDYMNNGEDVRIGFSLNDTEYYKGILEGAQSLLGTYMKISASTAPMAVKSEGRTLTVEKPELKEVTFKKLGIQDAVYTYAGVLSAEAKHRESLLNTTFTQKITFSAHTNNRLIYGGGEEGSWWGIRFITNADNGQIGVDCTYASEAYAIVPANVGETELLGKEIELKVELFESQETAGDLMMGVYINGKLYDNGYMKFTGAADKIGPHTSLYVADKEGTITIGTPGPVPTLDASFTKLTFNDYGVESGTYGYNKGTVGVQGHCGLKSMDKVIFSDIVNFSEEPGTQIRIGGKASAWEGVVLYSMTDGRLQLMNTHAEYGFAPITFEPTVAGMNLTGQDIELTMSFEYVDYDGDGKENDVKFAIWFNGKPYADRWYYLQDKAEELGGYFLIYSASEESSITIQTDMPPIDFEEYGFTINWFEEMGLKKKS